MPVWLVSKKKYFITLTPGVNVINIFFFVKDIQAVAFVPVKPRHPSLYLCVKPGPTRSRPLALLTNIILGYYRLSVTEPEERNLKKFDDIDTRSSTLSSLILLLLLLLLLLLRLLGLCVVVVLFFVSYVSSQPATFFGSSHLAVSGLKTCCPGYKNFLLLRH